jgi:hypothetical protein
MTYKWDGVEGVLYCGDDMTMQQLPTQSGELSVHVIKFQGNIISVEVDVDEVDEVVYFEVRSLGKIIPYPIARSDKYMVNGYVFKSISEKKEIAKFFTSALIHMRPAGFKIDLSDELKKEFGSVM